MMVDVQHYLVDEDATVAFGQQLGTALTEGGILFLEGVLGAGKTTLTRGVLRSLGYSGAVKSPTYTLVEPYELGGTMVYHFDLYRLGDPEELEFIGVRDYFSSDNICVVEWPIKGEGYLPAADLVVTVTPQGTGRKVTVNANTGKGQRVLGRIIRN